MIKIKIGKIKIGALSENICVNFGFSSRPIQVYNRLNVLAKF